VFFLVVARYCSKVKENLDSHNQKSNFIGPDVMDAFFSGMGYEEYGHLYEIITLFYSDLVEESPA